MTDGRGRPVRLEDATGADEVGGKAAHLAQAMRRGMPVPPGYVLPVSWLAGGLTDHQLHEFAADVLTELGGRVAVRSSSTVEDGPEASWAGQFETVLDVRTPEGVVSAVQRCLRSTTSASAAEYGEAVGDHGVAAMAVLVQAMLAPDAAGVASSRDPVDGTEHVVVEAVPSTGDVASSGEADPECWIVPGPAGPVGEGQVLTAAQAADVADLACRLDADVGAPVEIEWAITDGRLDLLQVRPLTARPQRPSVSLPPRQSFRRDRRIVRPLTPLSFSTWLPRHSTCLAEAFRRFGLPVATMDHRHLFGRVYSRAVVLGDPGRDDLAVPDAVLRAMLVVSPTMRRRLRNSEAWDGPNALDRLFEEWRTSQREGIREDTASLRDRDLNALTDPELAEHLDTVDDHIVQTGTWHFLLALAGTHVATGRLGVFCERRLAWPAEAVLNLLAGHGHLLGSPAEAFQALRAALPDDLLERAAQEPAAILEVPAVGSYLAEHGNRVLLELSQRTEAENLAGLVGRLALLDRSTDLQRRTAALRELADAAADRARAQLEQPGDRAEFDRLLTTARKGRPLGDESELLVHDAITLVRFAALEAARRLHDDGRLRRRDDIWFVELPELVGMLRDARQRCPDVLRRRREHAWALANAAPDHLGPSPAPSPGWRAIPRRWRATVGAALWAFGHEDGEPPRETVTTEGTQFGLAASPGTAEGPARIVRSPTDFARVRPGDVLVCPLPMAAWSAVFGIAAAVVTEHGGLLSHPATLARELGIPAVLQISGATTTFRDGELLRVHGSSGSVQRLGPPSRHHSTP